MNHSIGVHHGDDQEIKVSEEELVYFIGGGQLLDYCLCNEGAHSLAGMLPPQDQDYFLFGALFFAQFEVGNYVIGDRVSHGFDLDVAAYRRAYIDWG